MKDSSCIGEKCRTCDHSCGGLGKNLFTVEELTFIPPICFVDEVDLNDADKRLITNHQREGWQIAMIDALTWEELEKLRMSIDIIDQPHYRFNQKPWTQRAIDIFTWDHRGQIPTVDEQFEMNCRNDPRYRIEYMLLFPEMTGVSSYAQSNGHHIKLRKFLEKADEVIWENIKVNRYMGAPHIFRTHMREAEIRGISYKPSYTRVLFDRELSLKLS
jgi:hypothetical protein